MEKIIFKDFENLVPMIKDRWSPIYLERGRLEIDNYSLKWISSENRIISLPVAMLSCIILGPGSTITHAAIVSCSRSNTPVIWVGDEGLHFYAHGYNLNEKCRTTIRHAELYFNEELRKDVCRKMFKIRFRDVDTNDLDISSMRGMEGNRVRNSYRELSEKYKIPWAFRNSTGINGLEIDDLNLSLNVLNYHLYSLCLSVITTMGYIPSLGFFHSDGKIPFVYDIADLYKQELTFDVAFSSYVTCKKFNRDYLLQSFTERVSKFRLLEKLPKHLNEIMI